MKRKLSRLSFDVLSTVNDQTPGEFSSAGQFLWIPGRGPSTVGNVDYYTDPEVPYFAIAYDYPLYQRRNTRTYLMRSDITTQHWEEQQDQGRHPGRVQRPRQRVAERSGPPAPVP
jgi:hypothetical protein